jgi:hypothetical protein
LERDNHCEAIIGAIPIRTVVYDRSNKFSVKLFMKKIIFSLICTFFMGCGAEKEAQPVEVSPIPPKTLEEPAKQPVGSDEKVAMVPEVNDKKGKLDYEAINKDILKDVSKKIVDKATNEK